MTEEINPNDIAISAEEEISKHKHLIGLHNSEVMSKTSAYVDIKKPYQIPSSGFIDTAIIQNQSIIVQKNQKMMKIFLAMHSAIL